MSANDSESETAERPNSISADSVHVSVMPDEIVHWLGEVNPRVIVDGTYGGGGHARRLLNVIPSDGHVIGLDRDPEVSRRFESQVNDPRVQLFLGSYEKAPVALEKCNLHTSDGLVLDLGLSSDQLSDRERGFSFQSDGPLDLRFDPENGIPASEWLSRHDERAIADTIYKYGEERFSRRIARAIIAAARDRKPIETVSQLVDICRRCVPRSRNHDIHPATRTFQALRIVVNDELAILKRTLLSAPDWISTGGRVAIISFHSLEDRIVKNAFRDDDRWDVLTKKPLRPSERELQENARSRSAKLRVAQRR